MAYDPFAAIAASQASGPEAAPNDPANILPPSQAQKSGYKPLFRYASPQQFDADPRGELTAQEGAKRGTGWTKDTVLELQVYDEVMPYSKLMETETGRYLLRLAQRSRSGRRGFIEAFTTGSLTDFLPYVSDLAVPGIAIADMSKARDALNKMQEQGVSALSSEEKLWLKAYEQDSIRQSQQTWGATVGSIVRLAPAYAAEFFLTGGMFKLGTRAAAGLAKEGVEATGRNLIRSRVKGMLADRAGKLAGEAVSHVDDAVLKDIARETAARLAKEAGSEISEEALEKSLLSTARLQADALLHPKRFQGTAQWAVDHFKHGLLAHGNDVFARGIPAGVKARLGEALGVAMIEAPVKGGLYAAFDFAVVNPLVARAMGAEEAVTRNELMFASSEDKGIRDNAKWLAFGTAWAEYASENSGRAFNMLGSIAADKALRPVARMATRALAALPDSGDAAKAQGGYIRRLLGLDAGFAGETGAEAKAAVRATIEAKRRAAAEAFDGASEFGGKSAGEILADPKLSDQAVKRVMAQNSDKAFFGFWLADKMSRAGMGPDKAFLWLRNAGYDDILGEFMEERYNGFAQGLFGLDMQKDSPERNIIVDRLSRAAKGFLPAGGGEGAWSQATAEIVGFALPMVGRAAVNRAYASLGAGPLNAASDFSARIASMTTVKHVFIEGESGKAADRQAVPVRETGTPEETAVRSKMGVLAVDPRATPTTTELAENMVDIGMASGKAFTDTPGVGARVARGVLGLVNFAITGNPMMMFHDPVAAITQERLGNFGRQALQGMTNIYKTAFERERNLRVSGEASAAVDIASVAKAIEKEYNGKIPEAEARRLAAERVQAMTSTDTAAIDAAIRPQLLTEMRDFAKTLLHARGVSVVDKSDIDSLVESLKSENGGNLPTVFKDGKPVEYADEGAFKRRFREELAKVASERMSVRVVNGQAVFSVEKAPDDGSLFGYIDRFMAKRGIQSFMDVSRSPDIHGIINAMSAEPLPLSVYERAAGVKDLSRATPEEYAALRAVREATVVNPSFERENGALRADALARDRAKRIVAVNRRLLLPTYSSGGKASQVRFDSAARGFSLPGVQGSFETLEAVGEAAAAAGFAPAAEPKIYMTPFNSFFAENPAEFAALFKDYFSGAEHEGNPYVQVSDSEGGITMEEARRIDKELRARAAAGDATAAETVRRYDEAAAEVARSQNWTAQPLMHDPSRTGYMITAGAVNNGTGVYIPMKAVSTDSALVEDAIENAFKRRQGAFVLPGGMYRPAAKAFIADMRLVFERRAADLLGKADRTATEDMLLDQYRRLAAMFDAEKPNIEAISKAITGIVLYYGDAAVAGTSQLRESSYYAALGRVAKEARSKQSYKAFLATVGRLANTDTAADPATALSDFVRDLMPQEFVDGTDKTVDYDVPVNALQHILNSAAELAVESATAEKFLQSDRDVSPVFKVLNSAGAFLPEDYPALMQTLISETRPGAALPAEPAPEAPQAEAQAPVSEPEYDAPEPGSPATPADVRLEAELAVSPEAAKPAEEEDFSLLEGLRDPAQAALLALAASRIRMRPELMAALGLKADARPAMPGDRDFLKKAWELFRAADPTLPEATEAAFVTAYAEASGAFGSRLDAVNTDEDAQTGDVESETSAPEDGMRYDDDGIRKAFDRYPAKKAVGTLLSSFLFNPSKAGGFVGHVQDIYAAGISADGTVAPGSLADLLSGVDGEALHPALVRATFDKWVADQLATPKTRVETGFLVSLQAMGYDEALNFLHAVRGVFTAGAVKVGETRTEAGDGTLRVTNVVRVDTRTAAAGARLSLTQAAAHATAAEVSKALAAAKALAAEDPLPEEPAQRYAEIARRADALASVADGLFGGPNNFLSSALRSQGARLTLSRHYAADTERWLSASVTRGGRRMPGMMAQRLQDAAEELAATKDAKRAVSRLFADNVAVKDPSIRGAFNTFLNLYAATVPMEKAVNTDRTASVALAGPALSSSMRRVLTDQRVRELALGYFGLDSAGLETAPAGLRAAASKALAMLDRFGVWPDGTPVFANTAGAAFTYDADGQESAEPYTKGELASEFYSAAFAKAYEAGTGVYAAFQLASGDKSKALTVLMPRRVSGGKTLSGVFGTEAGYDAVYTAVAKAAGVDGFDLKRVGAVMLNYGAVVPMAAGTVVAATIPEDDQTDDAAEAFFGSLRLVMKDPDIVKTLGGGKSAQLKAHGSAPSAADGSAVMTKGLITLVSEDDAKNPLNSESEQALTDLYLKMSGSLGDNVVWGDMDAMKVTFHNSKVAGISENGKPRSAWTWLMANPDAGPDTEVLWQGPAWPEPRKVKLADVAPGLKIERGVKLSSGKTVTVVSYAPPGYRLQEVANLRKSAKPKEGEIPRNATRDESRASAVAEHSLTTAAVEALQTYRAAHPDARAVKYRDPAIAAAVASGDLPPESDLAARDVASSLARRALPETGLAWTVKAANLGDSAKARAGEGGPAFTSDGALIDEARPYGAGHPLSHGERLLPAAEAADYNGIRVRPASIQANIDDPLFRYALRPNAAHEAFKGVDLADAKATAVAIERLALALDAVRRSGSRAGYLEFLATEVIPAFTDLDGNAFPPGQVFSFDDLFVGKDNTRVFDRTAVEADDKGAVLNGGRVVMLRVPSGGPDAWVEARVFAPVTPESRTKRALAYAVDNEDGSVSWKSKTEAVKGAVEAEALVRDNPEITARTGNDHDGDTAFLWLFRHEASGRVQGVSDLSVLSADTDEAKAWRADLEAQLADPDKARAERALRTLNRWIWNSWLDSKMNWLRFNPASERAEGPQAPQDREASTLGITAYATSAEVFSPEFKAKLDAKYPPVKLNRLSGFGAARESDTARHMAAARGNAVHAWAVLHHLLLTFDAQIGPLSADSVLTDAKGRPFGGFTADLSGFTEADWDRASRFMSKWSNAYFDSLKGDASSERYGMDRTLVPLHFLLLAAARPKTQADYEAFFEKWAEWAHGPQARAIAAAARAEENPYYDGSGYFGPDHAGLLGDKTPQGEALFEALSGYETFKSLGYAERKAVFAASAGLVRESGMTPSAAAEATDGLAKALKVLGDGRALMRVMETESADVSQLSKARTFRSNLETAQKVLAGESPVDLSANRGVLERRITAGAKVADEAEAAYFNTYEGSQMAEIVAGMLGGKQGATPASRRKAASRRESVMRATYARGAALMLPGFAPAESLKTLVSLARGEDGKLSTAAFLGNVESAYADMFTAYSKSPQLAGSNAFMDQVIAARPGKAFQPLSLVSRDTADSAMLLPDLEAGLNALRDWRADDARLNVTVGNATVTPRDMFWALWLYTNLAAPAQIKIGRGSVNFAAAFGTKMLGRLAKMQVAVFKSADWSTNIAALALGKPVMWRGAKVADIFGFADPVQAGVPALDAAPAATAPARPAADVKASAETAAPVKSEAPKLTVAPRSETEPAPAGAEAVAALRALAKGLPAASSLKALADSAAAPALNDAAKAAAEQAAGLLEKARDLAGMTPEAAAVLSAGAAAVRAAGFERALPTGTLLAAKAALDRAGASAPAEALRGAINFASVDPARLQILLDNPGVVFGPRITPELQALMFAVAAGGFPKQAAGGAKTSDIALALGKKLFPGKALTIQASAPTASLLTNAQERFVEADNRVSQLESILTNRFSEAFEPGALRDKVSADLEYWKNLRARAPADVARLKAGARRFATASLLEGPQKKLSEALAEEEDLNGAEQVGAPDLVLGDGRQDPVDLMDPADLARASEYAARGQALSTPDRGNPLAGKAEGFMAATNERLDAIDFKTPRGAMETDAAYLARVGEFRRASVGPVSDLVRKMLASPQKAASVSEFDAGLRKALSDLRETGSAAAVRFSDAVTRLFFQDRNGNAAGLQFFGAAQDAVRYADTMKYLGNMWAGIYGEYARAEEKAEDQAAKARLAETRAAMNRVLAQVQAWASVTRMLRDSGAITAVEIEVATQRAAETPAARAADEKRYAAVQPAVMSALDPSSGAVDSWNDFHVHFVDPDVFWQGAVMPFFRGQDIRGILLDKASLAPQVDMYRTGNLLTSLYAAGNPKGTILRMSKIKGAAWRADGKGGYETTPEELRGESRHFERGTAYRDIARDSLDPEEFALARFMLGAISAALGDGGAKARMPVSGRVSFLDLPAEPNKKVAIGYDAAVSRVRGLTMGADGKAARPWAVDVLLLNARNNLPAAVYPAVEEAVRKAYDVFVEAKGTAAEKEMAAIESMRAAGYANRRLGTDSRGTPYLMSTVLTVPVAEVERIWTGSTAHGKLVHQNGRDAADLTLAAGMKIAEDAFRKNRAAAAAAGSWMLGGDAARMHGLGSHVPFFSGTGFHSYLAKKSDRADLPEYTERMQELYRSLVEQAKTCFSEDGSPTPLSEVAKRFPKMLKYYSDLFLAQGDPLKNDPAALLRALADPKSPRYLGRGASAWTLAEAIYRESSRRIHETAMAGGARGTLALGDVSLEEFNAAIDTVAAEKEIADRRHGMTWSEIYEAEGALPRNLGVDEMLTTTAQETAVATRYRLALNQALMSSDIDGRPLIYAAPGAEGDDTVPDEMWKQIAMWWAGVHGMPYDQSKTGRENATALYAQIVRGKETRSGVRETAGQVERYVFKDVKLPPGTTSFSAVSAAANRPGDDTKSLLSDLSGGEAAGFMTQMLAIPGFGHPGAAMAWTNRVLSWSKSCSVMWSIFFPIATAFESPVAAVGFGKTVPGLTEKWAEAARKAGVGDGSPYMADILRLIGSDDAALADLKVHAVLSGVTLSDRSRNMLDHDRQVLAQDIKSLSDLAAAQINPKVGKAVRIMLEGALEQSSELAFEYIINATKLSVFAQMSNLLRNKALASGKWWDPIRSMREWAPYINAEVGGIDPAMYSWATPQAQQLMKGMFFSWEWTLGAWSAGGGDVITSKIFGMNSSPATREFMFGRWFRMFTGVMIGIPATMQILATAMGKVAAAMGDDDDRKQAEDDKWFTWQNEYGRGWKDFDITPFLRAIAAVPGVRAFKSAHPLLGGRIPALTGEEGEMVSTRRRRYYAHLGKQGWEVAGWFQDPVRSFLGKLSMPAQKGLEGVLGITPSMGWEKEWKDLSFWERWTTLDPEKSALLNMFGAFVPFSLAGAYRTPEAGFLTGVMPVGKGMSKTRAEKEMAQMFAEWGDSEAYAAKWKGRPGAWTDLESAAGAWLEALRLNGYDPKTSLKKAVAAARKPLYARVHNALPSNPFDKVSSNDRLELEAAARGLYRLDFVARNLLKSIADKDRNQHIKRTGEIGEISNEALRAAFTDPYGRRARPPRRPSGDEARLKQSAALGGDVSDLLANDEVPRTVLGYRVLTGKELSADDLRFFRENPESPGFFDKEAK